MIATGGQPVGVFMPAGSLPIVWTWDKGERRAQPGC